MKKILSIFIFSLFILTKVFSLQISAFCLDDYIEPANDNRDFQWIKEKFNVIFEWEFFYGDREQKIGDMIASGELPDLVQSENLNEFQQAGCLIDLKPLIEQYCPNLKKHYESAWNQMVYIDSEKDENGKVITPHIYSLPNYGVYDGNDQNPYYNQSAFWIQKRVLKEFGYPTITTIEQYFDILKRYAIRYPLTGDESTIPFSILNYDWEFFNTYNPAMFLAGNYNDGNGYVIKKNGKYVYKDLFTDEISKRWYKILNKYYYEGVVDPQIFTNTRDQYLTKIGQGKILGMFVQGWEFMYESAYQVLISKDGDYTYIPLPIVFDETTVPHYYSSSLPNLRRGVGITKNCGEKKAIEILKFFDELIKEENQKRLYWGVEGEDYKIDTTGKITGKKGAPYRTKEQRENRNSYYWQKQNMANVLMDLAPKFEGTYSDGYPDNLAYLFWENTNLSEDDKEVLKKYNVSSYSELMGGGKYTNPVWFPMWENGPDFQKEGLDRDACLALMSYDVVCKQYIPKLVLGKEKDFETVWSEYVEKMSEYTTIYCKFMQIQLDKKIKNIKTKY